MDAEIEEGKGHRVEIAAHIVPGYVVGCAIVRGSGGMLPPETLFKFRPF